MTELSIDTKNKRVRVRLELLGEKEPIDVEILRYSLKEKDETTYINIEEATSSREWLTVALREFVVGGFGHSRQSWRRPEIIDVNAVAMLARRCFPRHESIERSSSLIRHKFDYMCVIDQA